jgi:hypothetical protein
MRKLLLLGVLFSTAAVAAEPPPQKFGQVTILSGARIAFARFHSTGKESVNLPMGCRVQHEWHIDGPVTRADAGHLSLEMGGHRYEFGPGTGDWQYRADHPKYNFHEGEPLLVHATGGEVPAFDAVVQAPGGVRLSGLSDTMTRDHDWKITWTGGSTGIVNLMFYGAGRHDQLSCNFPARDHGGVVPSALLQKLDPGQIFVNAVVANHQLFHLHDWVLRVIGMGFVRSEVPEIELR